MDSAKKVLSFVILLLSMRQQHSFERTVGFNKMGKEFTCPTSSGIFPISPESCSELYYLCSGWIAYEEHCPDGYLFDPAVNKCVLAELASCQANGTGSTTEVTSTSSKISSTTTTTTSEPTTTKTTQSTTTIASTTTEPTTSTTTVSSTTTAPTTSTTTVPSTTIAPITSTTTVSSTTTAPTTITESITSNLSTTTSGVFVCPGIGFYPYDGYCSNKYWACPDNLNPLLMTCPENLVFNPDKSNCVDPGTVPQCQTSVPFIYV